MKVTYRCYNCGETFEAEERVRTDICPHCMTFVDLSRAERADAPAAPRREAPAGKVAQPAAPAGKAAQPAAPAGKISPPAAPAGRGGTTYEALYAEAEKMMSVGAWGNASELFKRCLAKRQSWQARFGLVRAATRELTDLSDFSAVQKDASAAFSKMSASERIALGKRYVPALEERRRSLKNSYDAMSRSGSEEDAQGTKKRAGAKSVASAVCGVFLLFVFVAMGGMLLSFSAGFGAAVMGAGVLMCGVCIAGGIYSERKAKAAEAARRAEREKAAAARSAACAGLKAQMDVIDYLCGFLKY